MITIKNYFEFDEDYAKKLVNDKASEPPTESDRAYICLEGERPVAYIRVFWSEEEEYDEQDQIEDDDEPFNECRAKVCIAGDYQPDSGKLLSAIKKMLKAECKDAECFLYSEKPIDDFTSGSGFTKYYEDYLYKLPAAGKAFKASAKKSYKAFFVETGDDAYFVTIDDENNDVKDVAYCDLFIYDSSMCIADVYTEESYRRSGLATMLINEIRSKYPDKELVLHTESDNVAACELYNKLGFKIEQTIYNYGEI